MSEAESKRIFQKKFNALLVERRITQKDISAICEASTSTVSTWSKGLNMPRMDKIERLANYFGLPKSYFIEETETAPTPEDEREIDDEDLKAAFWGGEQDMSKEDWDEMWEDVQDFARFRVEQQRKKKNGVSN